MNSGSGSPQPDPTPEPGTRAKRGRVRLVLLGVGIVALIAVAIWFVHYQTTGKYMQSTSDAYVQADAVTVSPKVSGYVDRVFVAENQQVRAGQPLLREQQAACQVGREPVVLRPLLRRHVLGAD